MKVGYRSGLALAAMLLAGGVLAADALKSGPQVGSGLTPFNPLHCSGPDEGKKLCLV
jgi:hypothetical protein